MHAIYLRQFVTASASIDAACETDQTFLQCQNEDVQVAQIKKSILIDDGSQGSNCPESDSENS